MIAEKISSKAGYGLWHIFTSTFRVIAGIGIIGLIGYSLWVTIIQPHTSSRLATSTTHQSANKIVNQRITLENESCWINIFGLKTLCFKNEKIYKIIQDSQGNKKVEEK